MTHQDRLETLASIEQGYETADAVDRELRAISARSGNSEVAKFIWAAQEERALLQRVIQDQKAHAVAAQAGGARGRHAQELLTRERVNSGEAGRAALCRRRGS